MAERQQMTKKKTKKKNDGALEDSKMIVHSTNHGSIKVKTKRQIKIMT